MQSWGISVNSDTLVTSGARTPVKLQSDNKWGAHPGKTAFLDNKWVTLVTSRANNPTRAGGKEASNKWGAHAGKNAFPDNKWGAHPGKQHF